MTVTLPLPIPKPGQALQAVKFFAWISVQADGPNALVWMVYKPKPSEKDKTQWIPALDKNGSQLEQTVYLQ